MLELMRRPERRATILERVAWLRDAIPDLTLRTTVIVGFPGETDEDFEEMLDSAGGDRVRPCGCVRVLGGGGDASCRPAGPAAPNHSSHERLEELMEVQRGISFDRNLALVGTRATALVDRMSPETTRTTSRRHASCRRPSTSTA